MYANQRSLQGLQNKRVGENFEDLIADSLLWYEMKGAAVITKTPEPMRPIKRLAGGKFVAIFEKKAEPDFKGTLAGGRSVVFEAKHTDSDRIEYSRLTNEQADKLELYHNMGAVAFVLVSFGLRDFYRIPWEVWRDMVGRYGHKHMKQPECEPYRVHLKGGVLKMLEGGLDNGSWASLGDLDAKGGTT